MIISFQVSVTDKTNTDSDQNVHALTSDKRTSVRFKLAITDVLQNPYTFGEMKGREVKEFSAFSKKTVGRNLTISEVEHSFLRMDGPSGAKYIEKINGEEQTTFHFDNGKREFRVHGYYNEGENFCIIRIDPHHNLQY
ncbi:MAG6450 family protein [Secundilactobacillus paracollinoides]|uniref:MAG6450 family protein n=2 Tax=Secundilactobacillus paracollinoides TaxID=240427 RepID=UPI0006F18FC0|nr:hypothetical protein FC17_GL002628 [Secundilactobacillus paracollinoides DSM 15502 = JCM 11969]